MAILGQFQVEVEKEKDGRILASVTALPGVMAYGATEAAAVQEAELIALQVLMDIIECEEDGA